MNKDKFLGAIDHLQMKNRLLIVGFAVLLVLNSCNTLSLQRARTQMQTVIVPVGGGAGMTVGDGKASHEYVRQMARYLTSMLGTYTSATARLQLQEVLGLFAPEVVGKAQVEFERIAVQIERFPSIASVIRWSGDEALKISPNVIQIHAIKDRLVSGNVTESTQMTYCIEYRIDEARFWVLGIREETAPTTDVCFQTSAGTLASEEGAKGNESKS
jgi:type IV conjugative transfer system protein TraE